MKRSSFAAALAVLALFGMGAVFFALEVLDPPGGAGFPPVTPEVEASPPARDAIFGRVTTTGGETCEGRLRWRGDQEAFWGDFFNGYRDENPWVAYVPAGSLETEDPLEVFGIQVASRARNADLGRPFMARFGDIARIEARGFRVRVTLKSGTSFELDRLEAGDFDDGVRVWSAESGVVDIETDRIRTVEFSAAPLDDPDDSRLFGRVRTTAGEFRGAVQWNRHGSVGSDELLGERDGEAVRLRFDRIRAIERRSPDGIQVALRDGREVSLAGTPDAGPANRGIYVDDLRYGRVLVSWTAFERLELVYAGEGVAPGYDDFPPGAPLTGTVIARDGRRLSGRLVYDLDESETTETLDAPAGGVTYSLPFWLVASIDLSPEAGGPEVARVALHSGEELRLEREGDLGQGNAGVLVFEDGPEPARFASFSEVARIEFDRKEAGYPPIRRP